MDVIHTLVRSTSASGLVLRCAVALVGVAIIYSFIRAAASPLKSIPGPPAARFTRLWYLQKVWTGEFSRLNIDLHRKYGRVVRLAPNEYSLDDPAAVKAIYGFGQYNSSHAMVSKHFCFRMSQDFISSGTIADD